MCSRGRSVGRRHQRKRCFRCGLANHTPDKCKYKDFECFNCHLTGHSLSVAMQNHHQKRWRANKMYITLNRIQKLDCRRTCEMNFSGPFHIFVSLHFTQDGMTTILFVLSSLGATSNQPYPVLGRLVGRVAHRSPRHCTDEGNGSHLLMVAEH